MESLVKALPLEGKAAVTEGEVYFAVPVRQGKEKAKDSVEPGTIAYWPMGGSLCIFYARVKPYSAVNPVGRVTSNLELFKAVKSGANIRVEKA